MKYFLIASILLWLTHNAYAKSEADLALHGVIKEVKSENAGVSIVFTGIARLNLNDPSIKEPFQTSVFQMRSFI